LELDLLDSIQLMRQQYLRQLRLCLLRTLLCLLAELSSPLRTLLLTQVLKPSAPAAGTSSTAGSSPLLGQLRDPRDLIVEHLDFFLNFFDLRQAQNINAGTCTKSTKAKAAEPATAASAPLFILGINNCRRENQTDHRDHGRCD
jgi:hypothetical protein